MPTCPSCDYFYATVDHATCPWCGGVKFPESMSAKQKCYAKAQLRKKVYQEHKKAMGWADSGTGKIKSRSGFSFGFLTRELPLGVRLVAYFVAALVIVLSIIAMSNSPTVTPGRSPNAAERDRLAVEKAVQKHETVKARRESEFHSK